MAGAVYQVEGGRQLRRTLKEAGDDLQELKDTHAKVGTFVADRARPAAPRRTGRLAATGRSSGTKTAAIVRFGGAAVRYAKKVHWGSQRAGVPARPWVSETAQRTEPQWTQMYEQGVADVLARIKGV